jgi:hypothetical protein
MSAQPYGLLAEFLGPDELLDAVRRTRVDGHYTRIEAYSPYPIDGMGEALGKERTMVAFWMLLGGVAAAVFTYWLEWYSAVVNYGYNIGGRPPFSWLAFIPPAVELTLLWAVLLGAAAVIFGSRLPRLNHPLFSNRQFERASSDRYFLLVRGEDPNFDALGTQDFLRELSPVSITEVAP